MLVNVIMIVLQIGPTRAVANGPVGPAMAGPIIDPAIFFYFLNFLFLLYFLTGIIIEPNKRRPDLSCLSIDASILESSAAES